MIKCCYLLGRLFQLEGYWSKNRVKSKHALLASTNILNKRLLASWLNACEASATPGFSFMVAMHYSHIMFVVLITASMLSKQRPNDLAAESNRSLAKGTFRVEI